MAYNYVYVSYFLPSAILNSSVGSAQNDPLPAPHVGAETR